MPDPIDTDDLRRIALVLDRGFGTPTFAERHAAAAGLRELVALRAELARLRAIVGKGPTHRHVKRDTLYRHLGTGRIQTDEPLADDAEVEIYHGAHGDLWARRKVEFHDGRFAALSSQPDSGEGAG